MFRLPFRHDARASGRIRHERDLRTRYAFKDDGDAFGCTTWEKMFAGGIGSMRRVIRCWSI